MIVALRGHGPGEPASPPRCRPGARRGARGAHATCPRAAELLIPLAMMAVVGTLGFNFQVILPLLARFTFDGGAATYTALAVAMAVGSVAGRAGHGRARPGQRAPADRRRRSASASSPRLPRPPRRCRPRSSPWFRSARRA